MHVFRSIAFLGLHKLDHLHTSRAVITDKHAVQRPKILFSTPYSSNTAVQYTSIGGEPVENLKPGEELLQSL